MELQTLTNNLAHLLLIMDTIVKMYIRYDQGQHHQSDMYMIDQCHKTQELHSKFIKTQYLLIDQCTHP